MLSVCFHGSGAVSASHLDVGTLKVLPIFVFAFTCHQNIFSCWNEVGQQPQALHRWSLGG
jgi:amino acid permease